MLFYNEQNFSEKSPSKREFQIMAKIKLIRTESRYFRRHLKR